MNPLDNGNAEENDRNRRLLTIFAIPKPFEGPTALRQENAIQSWTALPADVVLFADTDPANLGLEDPALQVIKGISTNEFGTPFLNHAFSLAAAVSRTNVLCYANADIVFASGLIEATTQVAARYNKFLIVGRRIDLNLDDPIDFKGEWRSHVADLVDDEGTLHSPSGIDYFVFPRNQLRGIPPFLVGRVGWDNWMIRNALEERIPVIDATSVVMAVHLNHDYSHVPVDQNNHRSGREAEHNLQFLQGSDWRFSILSANRTINNRGIFPALSPMRYKHQLWAIRLRSRFSNSE